MSKPVVEEEWPEFVQLKEQVIALWFELKIFQGLFCEDENRVALLDKSANHFFYSLNFTIPNNLLRILSAIYDNPQTGSNANITVEGIALVSKTWISSDSCKKIAALLASSAEAKGKLRKFRNKKLSHLDHKVHLGLSQVQGLKRFEIELLSKTASDILNTIESDLFKSTTSYEQCISRAPNDILSCLESHMFLRTLQIHIRDKKMSTENAGMIISQGLHGHEWRLWCNNNDLDPKHYLPVATS